MRKEGVIETDFQNVPRARTYTTPMLVCGKFPSLIHLGSDCIAHWCNPVHVFHVYIYQYYIYAVINTYKRKPVMLLSSCFLAAHLPLPCSNVRVPGTANCTTVCTCSVDCTCTTMVCNQTSKLLHDDQTNFLKVVDLCTVRPAFIICKIVHNL